MVVIAVRASQDEGAESFRERNVCTMHHISDSTSGGTVRTTSLLAFRYIFKELAA